MAQVIWTETARSDLAGISDYLDGYSAFFASATIARFFERTDQLVNFPEMGRIIPEIGLPEFRELLEKNYRIMYELLDADIILIQRVIHQSQDFMP